MNLYKFCDTSRSESGQFVIIVKHTLTANDLDISRQISTLKKTTTLLSL